MNVYKRIEILCKKYNCSVADVAKNSGLSIHVVYDWRKKATEPTLLALLKVCEYFNIEIKEFFDCEDYTAEQRYFIDNFEKLKDKHKELIIETIKVCIENF